MGDVAVQRRGILSRAVAQPPAIGAFVLYRGRTHVLRGYSRAGLDDVQYADLEDALTADRVTVPVVEILSGAPPSPEPPPGAVVPNRPSL
jgi:hypothetical protein